MQPWQILLQIHFGPLTDCDQHAAAEQLPSAHGQGKTAEKF